MAEQKRRRVTTRTLQKKMENNEQIVQMAIYDYRSAVIADRGGTPSFELYAEADDMWAQVERGWSSIVARNEWADLWLFGYTSD